MIEPVKQMEFIKNYYRPIQPAVIGDKGKIIYRETKPQTGLENFVFCFWQLVTREALDHPYSYRVVSDGCIDIFFNHDQPVENFVMGFCRKYTQFPIGRSFDYIGIRFFPSAFPILFGTNAKVLSNQAHNLTDVLPDLSSWISTAMQPGAPFEKVVRQLNKKLTTVIENQHFEPDGRFLNSLHLIFQHNGYLDTERDLNTGLSPRQLRRVFNYYLGTTAKTFSNVVRFQHILNAKPSKQSLRENKIYYDAGFFDQAHFIKSFKTFYGVTPSEAFR